MTALRLKTLPLEVTDAREVHEFRVAEDLIRAIRGAYCSPVGASLYSSPEESIRRLGAELAEARAEEFRESVHADLPASWVRPEVELLRSPAEASVAVLVALTVERPELDGVWILGKGGPTLGLRPPGTLDLYGYSVEDGREVYGEPVPF